MQLRYLFNYQFINHVCLFVCLVFLLFNAPTDKRYFGAIMFCQSLINRNCCGIGIKAFFASLSTSPGPHNPLKCPPPLRPSSPLSGCRSANIQGRLEGPEGPIRHHSALAALFYMEACENSYDESNYVQWRCPLVTLRCFALQEKNVDLSIATHFEYMSGFLCMTSVSCFQSRQ
jgi:hypothetical protein